MKILQSTHSPPDYIPPPLLAPDQVVCGPHYPDQRRGDRVVSIKTPSGSYDIVEVVAALPLDQRPDLFVARIDSSGVNLPRNVEALKCRKVLLVGDTHHLAQPLRRLLTYALDEPYDAIIFDYTRQHAHFFIETGLSPVYWLPGINIRRILVPPKVRTDIPFSFVGQAGKFHPRRRVLCQALIDAKLPLKVMSAPTGQARLFHARSRVNLNCSLNGDLNLRVFEVLASGGFLFTDRLSPEAGLDLLFEDGAHLVAYGDDPDCIEKARVLLADPARTAMIAREGKARYEALYSTERIIQDFFGLLEGELVRPDFDLTLDRRCLLPRMDRSALLARVALYEVLQAVHIGRERVRMVAASGVDPFFVSDCADLPRLDMSIDAGEANISALEAHLVAAGMKGRIGLLRASSDVMGRPWDLVTTTVEAWQGGFGRDLLTRNPKALLLLTDRGADPALDAEIGRQGLSPVGADVPLYARGGS